MSRFPIPALSSFVPNRLVMGIGCIFSLDSFSSGKAISEFSVKSSSQDAHRLCQGHEATLFLRLPTGAQKQRN